MPDRPYTLLSCGMSIDGYLGSANMKPLQLSNDADFDRVDAVRAMCDAILVGAETVRNDNPRLLIRSRSRQDERLARGQAPTPMKVTVTGHGQLDPCADFFATGNIEKVVYCASATVDDARARLGAVATIVDGGEPVLVIAFESQVLQQKWVASELHGQVWSLMESHLVEFTVKTYSSV